MSDFCFAAKGPSPPRRPQRFVRWLLGWPGRARSRGHTLGVEGTERGLALAFLDEEEPLAASGGGGPPSRRVPDRQRQIMVRRAVGVGAIVVILILLVLGIRGCLNARTQRSFENYASDLTAIATQTNQLSRDFFGRLNDPGNLSPLSFEAQIAADRGTAEGLDTRVHALDTPGDLGGAQDQLNQAYDLRRDALTGISNQMKTALGNPGPQRTAAVNSIANYMQYFLASDVLYGLAQAPDRCGAQGPGDRPEGPGQRLHDRPATLARPARGLERAGRGVRAARRPAARTASPSSRRRPSRAT